MAGPYPPGLMGPIPGPLGGFMRGFIMPGGPPRSMLLPIIGWPAAVDFSLVRSIDEKEDAEWSDADAHPEGR